MSILKRKLITYPSMMDICGIPLNYRTGNLSGITTQNGNLDLSTIKPEKMSMAINEIHNFFINELGLVHIPVDGELDLNNIPDMLFHTAKTNSIATTHPLYQFVNNADLHSNKFHNLYGFKYYTFNDELNDRKPLYLKINYGAFFLCYYGSMPPKFCFAIELEIMKDIGGEVLISDVLCNSYGVNASTGYATYFQESYQNIESYGFNNENVLHVNIYPKAGVRYSSASTSTAGYLLPRESSYIGFYLARYENYFTFLSFSNKLSTHTINVAQQTFNSTAKSFTHCAYDGTKYTTSDNLVIPFVSNRYIANNNLNVFKSINIDPVTNYTTENNLLCSTYANNISTTGSEIIVDNGNGTKSKYLTYAGSDNICYVYSTRISLLFKLEDILNE